MVTEERWNRETWTDEMDTTVLDCVEAEERRDDSWSIVRARPRLALAEMRREVCTAKDRGGCGGGASGEGGSEGGRRGNGELGLGGGGGGDGGALGGSCTTTNVTCGW